MRDSQMPEKESRIKRFLRSTINIASILSLLISITSLGIALLSHWHQVLFQVAGWWVWPEHQYLYFERNSLSEHATFSGASVQRKTLFSFRFAENEFAKIETWNPGTFLNHDI